MEWWALHQKSLMSRTFSSTTGLLVQVLLLVQSRSSVRFVRR